MKKTETMTLAGRTFYVDDDACRRLKEYISAVESRFAGQDGGSEIILDIEARLSEIFAEQTHDGRNPLTLAHVDEAAARMGRPDDFAPDAGPAPAADDDADDGRQTRRLFRDAETRMLGGVCSGLAAYLGIDVVWVRLVFVVFMLWLIYLLLWIIVPEAQTASDRLRMRGEPINIGSIQKSVRESYLTARSEYDRMPGWRQAAILIAAAVAVAALVWVLVASGLHIAGVMPVRLVLVCGCIVGAYSCRPRWLRVLLTVLAIVLLVGSCGVLMPWWPLFNPFV